jgi:D-glycero-alpha-D-manno-heptose 1-phosphate guanylyltransferase
MAVTAVVLAGGRGTRLASLYPDIPKPLVPVCGEPFIHWVTDWLVGHGVSDIVYSVGYRAEQMITWAERSGAKWSARLRWVREEEPLGTGGGVIQCLPLCTDRVLVLNGDSLVVTPLAPLFAKGESAAGAILGVRMADASRYGTLTLDVEGRLTKFAEKRPGAGIINAGVCLFRRALLDPFPKGLRLSMEEEILPGLIAKGADIRCEIAENVPFLDIGTPESVAQAAGFVRANLYQRRL